VRPLRLRLTALIAALLVACQGSVPGTIARPTPTLDPDSVFFAAGAELPVLQNVLTSDPDDDDTNKPATAPTGGVIIRKSSNTLVLKAPAQPVGPRRVGIQIGHWKTEEAAADLAKLRGQIGARWDDVAEVDVNLDIGKRVQGLLIAKGIVVDLIPTTIPAGYVADAFVAIHADSDGVGELSGFKLAHGKLRGPFEDSLVAALKESYANATGFDYDATHITVDMRYYYAFNWGRFQHTTSPHTPAAILEMGYLSSDDDRAFLTERADKVADGIAAGIMKFLSDTPRSQIFKDDIVVQLPKPTSP